MNDVYEFIMSNLVKRGVVLIFLVIPTSGFIIQFFTI